MKKTLITLSLTALIFAGCKNDKKKPEKQDSKSVTQSDNLPKKDKDGLSVLTGDFIFTKKAAVINGNNFIYGVVLDSMAGVLAEKVEPVKRDQYDMVPVTIKGKIEPNPQKDGWDKVVKIKKILMISKPKSDPAIKIDGDKQKKINLNSQNKQNS